MSASVSNEEVEKTVRLRKKVLEEFVLTEKNYLRDLRFLEQHFIVPLTSDRSFTDHSRSLDKVFIFLKKVCLYTFQNYFDLSIYSHFYILNILITRTSCLFDHQKPKTAQM